VQSVHSPGARFAHIRRRNVATLEPLQKELGKILKGRGPPKLKMPHMTHPYTRALRAEIIHIRHPLRVH